jgi:hypothetical protein
VIVTLAFSVVTSSFLHADERPNACSRRHHIDEATVYKRNAIVDRHELDGLQSSAR